MIPCGFLQHEIGCADGHPHIHLLLIVIESPRTVQFHDSLARPMRNGAHTVIHLFTLAITTANPNNGSNDASDDGRWPYAYVP
jgi:hypothetical protein